jgi:hypothetical protein
MFKVEYWIKAMMKVYIQDGNIFNIYVYSNEKCRNLYWHI